MSEIRHLARIVGSRRMARDLIDNWDGVYTRPWWSPKVDIEKRESYPERERVIPAPKSEAPNV